jgi:hypothetical protein
MSGPDQLDAGETGTWTANVSNGTAPYTYTWYYKYEGSTWTIVGSNSSSYSQGTGNGETDFELKVQVEDTDSRLGKAIKNVVVGDFVPPGH